MKIEEQAKKQLEEMVVGYAEELEEVSSDYEKLAEFLEDVLDVEIKIDGNFKYRHVEIQLALAADYDAQENYFDDDFAVVTNCTAALQAQVIGIADELNQLATWEDCAEYFGEGSIYSSEDCTDENGNFIGGVYCVAFGGPTIYIDTVEGFVRGYWYIDVCEVELYYSAVEVLNEFFATLYNC